MRGRFWGLATALAALVSVFAPLPVGAQSAAILGIAKAASVAPERDGSFLITYDLRVVNLGSAEIRDVAVEDDLAAALPGTSFEVVSVTSATATVRPDYDGRRVTALLQGVDRLAAGESLGMALVVRVTPAAARATYSNTAVARGTSPDGLPVVDRSHEGTEPDPDWDGDPTNNDVPTSVEVVVESRIGVAKEVTSLSETAAGQYAISFSIIVENIGQVALSAVNVQDNLRLAFPSPAKVRVIDVHGVNLAVDPNFDGVTALRLLAGTDALAPGERGAVTLTLEVTRNDGEAWFENQVLVVATAPDGTTVMDFSNEGEDVDPDGDGDPTNNNRATDVFLATTSLSGFAETTVRLAALPLDVDVTSMLFNATVRVDEFSGRVVAKLTNTLFDLLTFAVTGPFGDVSVSSTLALNPSTLSFVSWQTTLSLDILGAALTDTVYLTAPSALSYNLVRVSGSANALDLEATVRLGICPQAFWDATVCADWDWGLCETPLSACVSFSASSGFESFQLTAGGIPLFESVLGVGATLDVRIQYTSDEKTVTPTLRFDPDWIICPEIVFLGEAVLTAPDPGISAIRVYGATVEVPIGDAVFRVADSFSDDKNASVVGKAAFFESFSLEVARLVLRLAGPP
ncbi:MAG: hypothetical protein NTX23_03180 [Candidatus Bipolaricaulota bacterium]|nr:hypothetical protein [Candidatus Bipolaricaulota bacterium]